MILHSEVVKELTVVLYHVTPGYNVASIEEGGINPVYSRGKLKASWYVNRANILWSIAHVSSQHSTSVDDLYVFGVLAEWEHMKRTARPGFFYTYQTYTIETLSPAIMFIELDK